MRMARTLGPILLAVDLGWAQAPRPVARTITVAAQGRDQTAPDTAVLSFDISSQDRQVRRAYALAQAQADQVRALLRRNGIQPQQAQLGSYQLQPNMDWKAHKVIDYTVAVRLSVELTDFQKIGGLLDQAGSAGLPIGQSVAFILKNDAPAKAQAIADGYRQARAEAEALAQAAGQRLAGLRSASIDVQELPIVRTMARAALAPMVSALPPTAEFTPQEITVTAAVNAVFDLAP